MTYGYYPPRGLNLGKNPLCVLYFLTSYCRSLPHIHPLAEYLNGSSHKSLLVVLTHRQLDIKNLDIQNRFLLSKWLFKLINEEGIWQSLLKKKYLKNETTAQVQKKPGDSHFWAGLMKVKDTFLNIESFPLNDGNQIRF